MYQSHNYDLYDSIEAVQNWVGRNAAGFAAFLVRKFGGIDAARRVINDPRVFGLELAEKLAGVGLGAVIGHMGFGMAFVGALVGAGVMEILQDAVGGALGKLGFDAGDDKMEKFTLSDEMIGLSNSDEMFVSKWDISELGDQMKDIVARIDNLQQGANSSLGALKGTKAREDVKAMVVDALRALKKARDVLSASASDVEKKGMRLRL